MSISEGRASLGDDGGNMGGLATWLVASLEGAGLERRPQARTNQDPPAQAQVLASAAPDLWALDRVQD